jgi:hypothetical protein
LEEATCTRMLCIDGSLLETVQFTRDNPGPYEPTQEDVDAWVDTRQPSCVMHGSARARHDDQCRPSDNDGNERCRSKPRGSGLRNQQRRLADCRLAGCRDSSERYSAAFSGGICRGDWTVSMSGQRCGRKLKNSEISWPPPKPGTHADVRRSPKLLSPAIVPSCGWPPGWRSPAP